MATQKKQRKTGKRSRKKASILDRLRPEEAQTVLQHLLAVHRELRSEVQQIAKSLLTEVEVEAVADEVEEAVRDVGLDELGSRAGRHSWGYTEPSEAAWELLEECVSPFLEDLTRRVELGLDAEALETCKGIVLGLYRVRSERGGDVLQWAPDFPAEKAAQAVATWRRGGDKITAGRGRRKRRLFPADFVQEFVPAWDNLIDRV
jgi:hypothetical protein